ncbi:NACHT domain-containing protein [Streptomyces sp. NPDC101206]|uniref:NACHT domain-containing protein n=1 Tax=Streptomyces sp. NPDC101206 TaxID=3366128 RepID=UPI0037F333B3
MTGPGTAPDPAGRPAEPPTRVSQNVSLHGRARANIAGRDLYISNAADVPDRREGRFRSRGRARAELTGILLLLLVPVILCGLLLDGVPPAGVLLAGAAAAVLAGRLLRPAVRQYRRDRIRTDPQFAHRLERQLDAALQQLGRDLTARWEHETRLRRLQHPQPLPVRWVNADELADHWPVILGEAGGSPGDGGGGRPPDLSGRFGELGAVYARVPSGRLLVLGDAGSGKSVLAARFALDRVRAAAPGERVPVVLPLASWDPRALDLAPWAAARLAADHPLLSARTVSGDTVAVGLLAAGRLLLVLDGFDEMRAEARPAALRKLRASLGERGRDPFVLTSRVAEYEAAVQEADAVLPATAAVRLEPLTLGEVADHLRHSVRKTFVDGVATTRWDPVLARLADRPGIEEDPWARGLREALSTPLMASLARTAFSDTGRDPAELLDPDVLPAGRAAVEDHLLDLSASPGAGRPQDSDRWLRFLARRLEESGTQDLAWWELTPGASRAVRVAGAALALAGATLLTAWLLRGQRLPFDVGLPAWAPYGLLCLLVIADIAVRGSSAPPVPRYIPRPRHAGHVYLLLVGSASVAGFVIPFVLPADSLTVMVGVWVFYGVVMAALVRWGRRIAWPAAPADAPDDAGVELWDVFRLEPGAGPDGPAGAVRADRAATVMSLGLVHLGSAGPAVRRVAYLAVFPALLLALRTEDSWKEPVGPGDWTVALGVVVAAWVVAGAGAAAWSGFAVGRTGLWISGLLPWRLFAYLDQAHRLGLLRQSGYTYRFRHRRLQERLAAADAAEASGNRPLPRRWTVPRPRPGRLYRGGMTCVFVAGCVAVLGCTLVTTAPEGSVRADIPACTLLTSEDMAPFLPGSHRREDGHGSGQCLWDTGEPYAADREMPRVKVSTSVYRPISTRSATAWAKQELKDEADPAHVVASYTSALPGLGDQAVSVLRQPDFFADGQTHVRVDNLVVSVSFETMLRTEDPAERAAVFERNVRASQHLARAAVSHLPAVGPAGHR